MTTTHCNLVVYPGEIKNLGGGIGEEKNIKCAIGIHKYQKIGHLYENHEPPSVAIYSVCMRCGKTENSTVEMATLECVTSRLH